MAHTTKESDVTEQQERELEELRKRLGMKRDPKAVERNWNRAWEANRKRAAK